MINYLSASDLIITRLRDKTSLLDNQIRAARSDDWVIKNPLNVPVSISVIHFDDQPVMDKGGSTGFGLKQFSVQEWMIVISANNKSDCGNKAKQDAGAIMLETLLALQGWKPSKEHGAMFRKPSPFRPTEDNKGFVHQSFIFATKINVVGIG